MIRLWDSWLATSITGGDVEVARAHLLVSSLGPGQEWRLWPTGILCGVGPLGPKPTEGAYGLGNLQLLRDLGRMCQEVILSTPYHLPDWSSHIGRSSPERIALGNVILGTCAAQRHHWLGCTDPSDMAVRCRSPSPSRGKSTPVPRYSICVTCSTNLKRLGLRKNWAGVASGRYLPEQKGESYWT